MIFDELILKFHSKTFSEVIIGKLNECASFKSSQ